MPPRVGDRHREPHDHRHGHAHRGHRRGTEVEHRGGRPRHTHLPGPREPDERLGGPGRHHAHRPPDVRPRGHGGQDERAQHRQPRAQAGSGGQPGEGLRGERDRRGQCHRRVHRPRPGHPGAQEQRVRGHPGPTGGEVLTQQEQSGDHRDAQRERQYGSAHQGEVRERPRRRGDRRGRHRRESGPPAEAGRQDRDPQHEHHPGRRGDGAQGLRQAASGQPDQQRRERVIGVRVEEVRVGGLAHRREVGQAGPPGLGDEPGGAAVEDGVPALGNGGETAGGDEDVGDRDHREDDDDEVRHPRARPAAAGVVVVLPLATPPRLPVGDPGRDTHDDGADQRGERSHPGRDDAPAQVHRGGDRAADRHHRERQRRPGRHRVPPPGAGGQADHRPRHHHQRHRGEQDERDRHGAQRTRKITVRWTMKLVTVATPWAMT